MTALYYLVMHLDESEMTSKMMMFHVPDDEKLLAALGEVTLRHEHLNHILRMTIKTVAGLRVAEAIDATKYDGSRQLRERIRKLARKELGEGAALLKLQALLTRAGKLTDRRNELTHGLWAQELDGEAGIMAEHGELQPIPTVHQLKALAGEIAQLTAELNRERLEGFLCTALANNSRK